MTVLFKNNAEKYIEKRRIRNLLRKFFISFKLPAIFFVESRLFKITRSYGGSDFAHQRFSPLFKNINLLFTLIQIAYVFMLAE